MTPLFDTNPLWWDRDADDQGKPIRADVRQAARELWPEAVKRVQKILSDSSESAELMEKAVVYISHHLNRAQIPFFAPSVPSLLSLHFSQALRRLAMRRGRIQLVNDATSIEGCAVIEGWADQIDRQLDFEKIVGYLNHTSRTIVAMRIQEHEWQLIADKIGMEPSAIRRAFWRDLHEVLLRLGCRNGVGRKGRRK